MKVLSNTDFKYGIENSKLCQHRPETGNVIILKTGMYKDANISEMKLHVSLEFGIWT